MRGQEVGVEPQRRIDLGERPGAMAVGNQALRVREMPLQSLPPVTRIHAAERLQDEFR